MSALEKTAAKWCRLLIFLRRVVHFQMQQMKGGKKGSENTKTMRIAQEAIANSRTVTTLCLEDYFYEKISATLNDSFK